MPRDSFHAGERWSRVHRAVIAALVAAVLLAVYGATGLWGAALASIGAVMLLAVCVLVQADRARRLAGRLDDLCSDVDRGLDALKESHKTLADDIGALRGDEFIGLRRRLDDLSSDIEEGLDVEKKAHKALSEDVGALSEGVGALSDQVRTLSGDVGALRGEEYIGFSRRLSPEAEIDLCSAWSDRVGRVVVPRRRLEPGALRR